MSDRYEIDIEKKASSYLNSLATALGEGKKRALIELKQADTFVNRLFNRKKVDQLAKIAHRYAAYEHDVKSNFNDKLSNYEITVPEDPKNGNEFGKQIETAFETYFKEQEEKLTPENSIQAYLDFDRPLSNFTSFLEVKTKDDDKMKQKENDFLLEKEHEIREPIKVEVQVNSKQKGSKRSIGLER